MAWNGTGTFTRTNGVNAGATVWNADAASGVKIVTNRHDTHDQDLATGINNCLTKDGQNEATANLNIGGFKLTNLANATARTDAVSFGQVQDGVALYAGNAGGSANALTLTLSPAITSYATGSAFTFKATATNTATSTLNINSVGAITILNAKTGSALAGNEIISGSYYSVIYNGTNFLLLDPAELYLGYAGTSGGTANAQTLTTTFAVSGLKTGRKFGFLAGATNTGGTTLAINGGAATTVQDNNTGTTLKGGEIQSGLYYEVIYNGSQYILLNPHYPWGTWTPTISDSGGSPSGTSSSDKNYIRQANICFFSLSFGLTTSASGTISEITATLPFTAGASLTFVSVTGETGVGETAIDVVAYITGSQNKITVKFADQTPSQNFANSTIYSFTVNGFFRV